MKCFHLKEWFTFPGKEFIQPILYLMEGAKLPWNSLHFNMGAVPSTAPLDCICSIPVGVKYSVLSTKIKVNCHSHFIGMPCKQLGYDYPQKFILADIYSLRDKVHSAGDESKF